MQNCQCEAIESKDQRVCLLDIQLYNLYDKDIEQLFYQNSQLHKIKLSNLIHLQYFVKF